MRTTRSTAGAVLAAAAFLITGCAGGASDEGAAPASESAGPSPLASFDTCAVFSQAELQTHGLESGEPVDQDIGEPGCRHRGDPFYLTVYKSEQNGLDHWEGQRSKFGVFEPNQVGARQGIRVVNTGSQGQGICHQVIAAGGGTVDVQVKYRASEIEGSDPCAKATEIAEQIEPKLPA